MDITLLADTIQKIRLLKNHPVLFYPALFTLAPAHKKKGVTRRPPPYNTRCLLDQTILRGAKDMVRNSFLYSDSPIFLIRATPIL